MPECICDSITEGILKECLRNSGGNRRLWLTEKCNILTLTIGSPLGYKEFTMEAGTKFYKFEFNKKGGLNYDEKKTGDSATGSEFYLQTATLKLNRREKAKRATLLLMSHYKEMVAIIEDSNGLFWLIGEEDGLILQDLDSGTGDSKAGANGYTLVLVGEESEPAMEVAEAFIIAKEAAGFIDTL